MKAAAVAASAAPSIGPAVVTLFGTDVPVIALATSVAGLILARVIAPPPLRKLTAAQEVCLTLLLLVVLFLLVTGAFTDGRPMEAGPATVIGIGLGFSGILVIEFFGERAMSVLRAIFGKEK